MKKALSSTYLAAATMALSIAPAWAADKIDISPRGEFKVLEGITIPLIISGLIKIVLIVAALVFFFMLIIGGIQWMTSGGDKAATEAARGRITAALVGLVIVFAAYAIVQLINTLFGLDILEGFTIPTFTP